MKKFAKIMAAVLVVAALFSLCACGQKVTLKILDTEYAVEDYAIAVAKENEELLEKIDTALCLRRRGHGCVGTDPRISEAL